MAKIYKTDGKIIEVEPKNGVDFSWEELRDIVGGFIEIVFLPNKLVVLNEHGKIKGLSFNEKATILAKSSINAGDYIAGNVLVCNRDQIK